MIAAMIVLPATAMIVAPAGDVAGPANPHDDAAINQDCRALDGRATVTLNHARAIEENRLRRRRLRGKGSEGETNQYKTFAGHQLVPSGRRRESADKTRSTAAR
jgi:hypothetical protein